VFSSVDRNASGIVEHFSLAFLHALDAWLGGESACTRAPARPFQATLSIVIAGRGGRRWIGDGAHEGFLEVY